MIGRTGVMSVEARQLQDAENLFSLYCHRCPCWPYRARTQGRNEHQLRCYQEIWLAHSIFLGIVSKESDALSNSRSKTTVRWFLIAFLKIILQSAEQSGDFDNVVVLVAWLLSVLWLSVRRWKALWVEAPGKGFKHTRVGAVVTSLRCFAKWRSGGWS